MDVNNERQCMYQTQWGLHVWVHHIAIRYGNVMWGAVVKGPYSRPYSYQPEKQEKLEKGNVLDSLYGHFVAISQHKLV